MTPEFKLARAKAALILEQPFFATLAVNSKWIRDDTCPTMETDGENIYWSGQFVDEMTLDECKFVICHEIMHCVFDHMGRLNERDAYKWNVATDIVINDILTREGVGSMPKGGLLNPGLAQAGTYLAEAVYNLLPDTPPGQQGGAFSPQDGSGKSRSTGPLDQLKPRKGSPAQQSQSAAEMKVKVAQAAQAAKMCGRLSGNLERFVTEVLKPKVDWKEVLRAFVSSKAKVDRSWARPNRRLISQGIYLPSLSGEKLGQVLIAVDCSGSIGPRELNEFTAEISAIHEDCKAELVHVVYFDSAISHYECYGPGESLNIRPHGGGGTDFAPIFEYMRDKAIEPCCVVVLTDGYCGSYGHAPDCPVLWVTTGEEKFPWGRVVSMKG